MSLGEVLKWIALIVLILCAVCPLLLAFLLPSRRNGKDVLSGCSCAYVILAAGFWAAVIACIVKFITKYLV